jgi:hypothetical protein
MNETTVPSVGQITFDVNSGTYSMYTGTDYSTITLAQSNMNTDNHVLSIGGADNGYKTVKVGNLVLSIDEFELCLRHLLTMTKSEYPEEFI